MYLVNLKPSQYIIEKYIDAHQSADLHILSGQNGFDRVALAVARKHIVLIKLADIYTAIFSRTSLLRKKLVLLLQYLRQNA
jgi:hypothetical protein